MFYILFLTSSGHFYETIWTINFVSSPEHRPDSGLLFLLRSNAPLPLFSQHDAYFIECHSSLFLPKLNYKKKIYRNWWNFAQILWTCTKMSLVFCFFKLCIFNFSTFIHLAQWIFTYVFNNKVWKVTKKAPWGKENYFVQVYYYSMKQSTTFYNAFFRRVHFLNIWTLLVLWTGTLSIRSYYYVLRYLYIFMFFFHTWVGFS